MIINEITTLSPSPEVPFQAPLADIHHHVVPPGYVEVLEDLGLDTSGFPDWTPRRSLELMARLGISRAILSLSSPGVWFGDHWKARALARTCNDYVARLKSKDPGHFGGLAILPLPDMEGSRQELARALDSLDLDGVILLTNVAGRYVGDPEFDELMVNLHQRKATVLLHPNDLPEDDPNAPLYPWVESPIDLARAWSRMVYREILARFQGIRWVLAHAGGVVPFMAERLGKVHYLKNEKPRWGRILLDIARKRDGGLELAKGVEYDTVGAANPITLAGLRRLAGPGRIRFGTNFPWDSEEQVEVATRFLTGATEPSPAGATDSKVEG